MIKKVILLIVMIIVIISGFNSIDDYSKSQDLKRIEQTIEQLCIKCYSLEGVYPSSIDYLKKYYGLIINEDDYQIVYYYQASNIRPYIKVFKKGVLNE